MGIKRYIADKDNVITNAYQSNLVTRGTGSNMGLASSLEVFSIYAQATSASVEKARTIVQFPITSSEISGIPTILSDRTAGTIPASGSVDFFLKVYNVATDQTLPRNFTLVVSPLSQSWEEGSGIDLDNYTDLTYGGTGSNWINARATTPWVDINGDEVNGGSYLSASWSGSPLTDYDEFNYRQTFGEKGTGDVEINITGLVEQWVKGTAASGFDNFGAIIKLTGSQESARRSYYTKRFSSRSSEYFFSRPVIEARWDDSTKDNRGNFIVSSSALSSANNLNTIYLYNYYRGQPADLAPVDGDKVVYVSVFNLTASGVQLSTSPNDPVTGGWVSTGVYTASFALNTTASVVYDRWFSTGTVGAGVDDADSVIYHTGTIKPQVFDSENRFYIPRYVTTIQNLEDAYRRNDIVRLRLFTRLKNWNPNIYTVASTDIQNSFVENAYYKVYRIIDNKEVIAYGTGSLNCTRLSYDVSGSYFDLDMSLLEENYSYGIKFSHYINGVYKEQAATFKFRVDQ